VVTAFFSTRTPPRVWIIIKTALFLIGADLSALCELLRQLSSLPAMGISPLVDLPHHSGLLAGVDGVGWAFVLLLTSSTPL